MPRKKGEEYQPWLNPHLHVWRNKVGDLTVINLRNPDVDLGPVTEPVAPTPKPLPEVEKKPVQPTVSETRPQKAAPAATATAAPAAPVAAADPCIVTAVKSASASSSTAEVDPVKTLLRQFMAKNEQSKKQQQQPPSATMPAHNSGTTAPSSTLHTTSPAATPVAPPAAREVTVKHHQSPPAGPAAANSSSAPVAAAASSQELLSSSPTKPMAFEFVSGTNIPGRGVVVNNNSPPAPPSESPPPSTHGVALFHDPLWGDVDPSLFLPAATASHTPQTNAGQTLVTPPPPSQQFYDLGVFQQAPSLSIPSNPPTIVGRLPMAAPTTAAFQALPAGYTAAAAPQITMAQLSGLQGIPMTYLHAPTAAAMMPIQYIFSGDSAHAAHQAMMLQGALHAAPAMQPQQQQQPQQLRVNVAAAMPSTPPSAPQSAGGGGARAGTNVEAQPFVPGGNRP